MAVKTPGTDPDISMTNAQYVPQVSGDKFAGEDLPAGRLCYMENGDSGTQGRIYLAQPNDGAGSPSADHRGRVLGVTARSHKAGEPVTLFGPGTLVRYSDGGLTPGNLYYVGTDGQIDDSTTLNDDQGIAIALTTDAYILLRYGHD